jgi:hypothetical protein
MTYMSPQNTEKKTDQVEELKTEGPLSEKDEVKAAEKKTAKLHKKAAQTKKKSK